MTPHPALHDAPAIGIHRTKTTFEMASDGRRELALHLIAETVDLV